MTAADALAVCAELTLVRAVTLDPGLRRPEASCCKPDREAGFYVLRTQESLAKAGVLLETMFISNPAEERLLSQPIVQFRFACAVASGLLCEQPAIS
jgi:hypothetical protein